MSVISTIEKFNPKFAARIEKDKNFGSSSGRINPEITQDYQDKEGNNIIAISSALTRSTAKEYWKERFAETAGFIISHASGHMAG